MENESEVMILPPEPETEEEQPEEAKQSRTDDAAAMQAAVCLVLGFGLLITDIFLPETAAALLEKLHHLSSDAAFILPDPIDWIISHWQG